jgi:hypothetical protein
VSVAIKWAYGVTTVPQRRRDLLPQTLASLKNAGFAQPRLFVDGDSDPASWEREFALEVTCRKPPLRTFGNWVLALWELLVREPTADRFAIFQDDLLMSRNVRQYLERTPYPERGYLNLYTFPSNQSYCPAGHVGWFKSRPLNNGPEGFQTGRGAVALIFSREAVLTLLASPHMVERPLDAHKGWKKVDGGIVTAMNKAGWWENCHSPSLTQHTGAVSTMDNLPHKLADSFRGADFDALTLLENPLPTAV